MPAERKPILQYHEKKKSFEKPEGQIFNSSTGRWRAGRLHACSHSCRFHI